MASKKRRKNILSIQPGGRIKIKQFENGPTIPIETQQKLQEVLSAARQNTTSIESSGSQQQQHNVEENDDTQHARTQQNGSSDSRNVSSIDKDNNSSNKNSVNYTNNIDPIVKVPQSATTNPALQRFISHQSSNQRYKRPSGNQLSSKIRSDVKQHRIDSRDRAYRGNLDMNGRE